MKMLVSLLTFIALPIFAQQTGPKTDKPPIPVHPAAPATQRPPTPPPFTPPQFTQLEQVIANDIASKQSALQQEINDFLREVRTEHPGFEFANGSLVPISPTKPEEKK
jgi:hypothetical protein